MGERVNELDEPPASPGPSSSQENDPGLVRFLIAATVIFAAAWFGISLLAGSL